MKLYRDTTSHQHHHLTLLYLTLFRGDDTIPKEIKPTACMKEAYDLIDKTKEHILMYNCKKVVRGFKGRTLGDEDLWNFEGPSTVKESIK